MSTAAQPSRRITRQYSGTLSISNILPPKTELIAKFALGLAAAGVLCVYAFAFTFTTFGPFDDDGYFLQTYRDFLSGRTAYDQVFSFYGPFTFYGGALIARFHANNVTHDTFRWAYLVLWIIIALLMAGIVWRWTGRFTPSFIAFFLIGFRLLGLAVSIGHPQIWVLLAAAVLLSLGIDWVYMPNRGASAFCTGVVMAVILLCKINIGVFISAAVALTSGLLFKYRLRSITTGIFLIPAIALGLMVFFAGSTASEKYFASIYVVSLVGTVAIAIRRPSTVTPCIRNLFWLVAGVGASLLAGLGLILLCGTSIKGLFNALIVYPALLARSYHQPFSGATKSVSILISIAGFCAAILSSYLQRASGQARAWLEPLKVASGAGLVFAFIRWPQETLTGSFLFLWLLLVDESAVSQPRYANRLLLAILCLLFSLQLFPVAGTQLVWAELLPIVAACVLMADGINAIERDSVRAAGLPAAVRVTALWLGPLLATLLFLSCGQAAFTRWNQWHSARSLGLPGAYWLRLPPDEAVRLTFPTKELRQRCHAVLTLPGLYSYSLWSGVPSVEEKRINSGPFLWPEEILNRDLPKLREKEGGCVLVSGKQYRFFKSIAVSQNNDEILSEVQRTMSPIYKFGDITIYQVKTH
jgi:hypothetical protein